jgi:nucleoside-diphosphate-sugar epimerase
MISINELAEKVIAISGKTIGIKHIEGALGVRGRNSNNDLIQQKLNWSPNFPLQKGLELTYKWINTQVNG